MAHRQASVKQADVVGALVSSAAYAALGAAVVSGKTSDVDHALRRSQRHRAGGPRRAVAEGVKRVARPEIQLGTAAAVTLALHYAGVRSARAVLGASVLVFIADRLTKPVAHRRRPPGYHGLKKHESFPSGHTAATTALTLTIARVLERAELTESPFATVTAGLLIALVGESRLALDEHWPTDVLGGVLLGTAASSLALVVDGALRGAIGRPLTW